MKVSSVSQMRSLDRRAIEEFGIEAKLLMENAGHAAYYALRKEFEVRGKRFLVFCGTGNNGGDGCVLARKIHADGGFVKVFILGNPGRFRGAAKLNYEIITRLSIEVRQIASIYGIRDEIVQSDLIVDAIFGTGLSRDVEGIYRDVIEIINRSKKPVLSIDIPSGVHGDSGKVMGVAVKANYTVTFGLPKYGNMLYPGFDLGGKLYLSHISFPPLIYMSDTLKVEVNHPKEFATVESGKIDG
jgi:NAD(P)H-hydrate epimerase